MQRVTITIDDDLVVEIDAFMAGRGYANRSEAIRDLARSGLSQSNLEVTHDRNCVATLSYVYDHAARELPKRLTQDFHAHHGLAPLRGSIATGPSGPDRESLPSDWRSRAPP